jgi:hypothetical protein
MLYCVGETCPLRHDCYRHTQPSPGRDRFGSLPYDPATGTCDHFVSNIPSEALTRTTAYYIWQRHGCPEGRAQEHWGEAYASLCGSTGRIESDGS